MASQEDPPNLQDLVEALKKLVLAEKGLKSRTDNPFMIQCLRSREYDVEKSLIVLKAYYKNNSHHPLDNYKPSAYKWMFDLNLGGIMPIRNHNGAAVYVFSAEHWDPSVVSAEVLYGSNMMLFEQIVQDEDVQKNGIIAISNLKGFSWKHVKALSPGIISKFATILQDNFPIKFLGVHIINNPAVFSVVYAIAKPFLREPEKIVLHGSNFDPALYQSVSKNCLPQNFGGEAGEFCNKESVDDLMKMEAFFVDNQQYGFKKS